MIRLEDLRKEYPGQDVAAVEDLNLSVGAGEICVLVGPSGCGKTTTMKMINRLIEPSSGRIILDGEDVTRQNADHLRRRIGYVIQRIGLFPHITIADHIGLVPKMLGWKQDKIKARTDELLDLVGMDPTQYRGRYPKQLSGGQQQRVGVARALSADPPVMLMDEPFGAVDPITRDRLQNEFLRLQQEVKKTIVFVTHDIDEAIKMGDRIAILQERSVIAQYDTPATILAAPANDFVRDFIGGQATLRGLGLVPISGQPLAEWPTVGSDGDAAAARDTLSGSDRDEVLVVDADRRPLRWVPAGELSDGGRRLTDLGRPVASQVPVDETLAFALDEMIGKQVEAVPVVDDQGCCVGVMDLGTVLRVAGDMRRNGGSTQGQNQGENQAALEGAG